jgi:5-methylcytosine-specific restriction protein B
MPVNTHEIEAAASSFQLPPSEENDATALHARFLKRFPLEKLKTLTLEEYALGVTNPTGAVDPESRGLCWWIEFGTEKLGRIGGATAFKHIIFYDADAKEWRYKGYASETEAFAAVRDGLLKILDLASTDHFDKIDTVPPFENQNLTRGKYLYLYFPERFQPIYSPDDLSTFCELLGIHVATTATATELNRSLVAFKQSHEVMKAWSNFKFMKFLYTTFNPHERFWKIAPGENARLWDECRDGGYICVGWEEMGDLGQYKDRSSFNAAFEKYFPGRRPTQLWNFRSIVTGDHIIANNGEKEIVGVGVVTGKYFVNNSRSTYNNCFPVNWTITQPFPVPKHDELRINWRNTIHQLSRHDFEILTSTSGSSASPLKWRRSNSDGYDLQLEHGGKPDVKALSSKFDEVLKSRQLSSGEPYLNAECRDGFVAWLNETTGVFPAVCLSVLSNWFLTSLGTDERKRATGELWDLLFRCRPESRLTEPGKQNIIADEFDKWWNRQLRLQNGAEAPKQPARVTVSDYAELCSQTFLPETFFADCEELLRTKKQLILQGAPGTGKTFVAEHLANWWAGAPERVSVVQFHESYGYEDFVHGIRPEHDKASHQTVFAPQDGAFVKCCQRAKDDLNHHNYVMVIDEINRAKTARVFGELLYLLEYRNKSVSLQYGQTFSIPPNVFIIGTMNTVDRSIALVDYALRRRFAFLTLRPVENGVSTVLAPWMEACGIDNAEEIDSLFVELNKLVAEQDEGLMVGHSYFMSDAAKVHHHFSDALLRSIWRYYIIPLVAEYEYQLDAKSIEDKYGLEAVRKGTQNGFTNRAEE